MKFLFSRMEAFKFPKANFQSPSRRSEKFELVRTGTFADCEAAADLYAKNSAGAIPSLSFLASSKHRTMAKVRESRNEPLTEGIGRYSRSAMYKKRALYKRKKTGVKKEVKEVVKTKVKEIGGDKNGGTRTVPVQREPRYYPTEDSRRKLPNRKKVRPTRLRSSLTPGTVVILLAGRHQGKRVVFLKQLPSGLLLVTGPYKLNAVPLRRVPQSYVIATQTKIDISGVDMPDRVDDDYFKREKRQRKRTEEMFDEAPEERTVSDERKEDQKAVDEQLAPLISNEAHLTKYLKTLFSLRKGQYPHEMIF